jgi:hypothetical protein
MMKTSLSKVPVTVILFCSLSTSSVAGLQKEVGEGARTGEASERAVIEQAITAVIDTPSAIGIRELFTHHLQKRSAAIPAVDKLKYWRELKVKPLKGIKPEVALVVKELSLL